jgi:hydrogenase maturation protease
MKVIGVGNELRGDDAIGRIVAEGVRECGIPGLTVEIQQGDGLSLLDAWRGESHVVVVDCAVSGGVPGRVHLLSANEAPVDVRLYSASTHTIGVGEAIELARILGELPARLDVYAIEGACFAPGAAVSPEVLGAAASVIRAIVQNSRPSPSASAF